MADEDVSVKFGGSTEELEGAARRGAEAVGQISEGVDGLSEKLTHLAELFGIAFTVEGIKDFVESMAELGEKVEITAATLGISNEKVVELSGIAKLAGTSIEKLNDPHGADVAQH